MLWLSRSLCAARFTQLAVIANAPKPMRPAAQARLFRRVDRRRRTLPGRPVFDCGRRGCVLFLWKGSRTRSGLEMAEVRAPDTSTARPQHPKRAAPDRACLPDAGAFSSRGDSQRHRPADCSWAPRLPEVAPQACTAANRCSNCAGLLIAAASCRSLVFPRRGWTLLANSTAPSSPPLVCASNDVSWSLHWHWCQPPLHSPQTGQTSSAARPRKPPWSVRSISRAPRVRCYADVN
jgi:hypothetical protein